ncbi:hypothetical protein MHYP_G00114850 [Metynnis hypsauchen]
MNASQPAHPSIHPTESTPARPCSPSHSHSQHRPILFLFRSRHTKPNAKLARGHAGPPCHSLIHSCCWICPLTPIPSHALILGPYPQVLIQSGCELTP